MKKALKSGTRVRFMLAWGRYKRCGSAISAPVVISDDKRNQSREGAAGQDAMRFPV